MRPSPFWFQDATWENSSLLLWAATWSASAFNQGVSVVVRAPVRGFRGLVVQVATRYGYPCLRYMMRFRVAAADSGVKGNVHRNLL